jgi:hypothetical protein
MNDISNEHGKGSSGPQRWRGLRRASILATAAASVALLATACGGSSASSAPATAPPPTAAAPTTTAPTAASAGAYQAALAYAQCMRSNGEQSWPDPNSDGYFTGDIDMATVPYLSANKACAHLLPNGGVLTSAQAQQAVGLLTKYAACMRSHGIPQFPDPNPQYVMAGETGVGYVSVDTLKTTAQRFASASQACRQFQPSGARAP